MMRHRLFVLVVTAAIAVPLERISLRATPGRPHVMVDTKGRERLFHGPNAIVKGPPWHPDTREFSRDISLSERDFKIMQSLGSNMVRLSVMWPGVEPIRGWYNDTYLDEIDRAVRLAAEHGLYTLLDMHQDGLSEYYCGEGIPWWAVRHTQGWLNKLESKFLKAFPAPFDHFDNNTDFYYEHKLPGSPRLPTRRACATHKLGPGWHEATKAAANSYEALYTNVDGMGDAWAAMWAYVARRFSGRPEVLGLELMNEPFAGDLYLDPLIMVPRPNPHNADRLKLQPAYDRINAAVRAVDQDVLIFFAGVTWDDLGSGFTAAPGGAEYANRSVLAFHYYDPPQRSVTEQFSKQRAAAERIGTGAFMTETSVWYSYGGVADGADRSLTGWSGYEWKGFYREAASGASNMSQMGDWGSDKTGVGTAWKSDELEPWVQASYARSFSSAVAGNTVSMYFNVSSKAFELQYDVSSEVESNVTQIYVWPNNYPHGLVLNATSSIGSMSAQYDGNSSIQVTPGQGVEVGARVVVVVTPHLGV